LKAIDTNILVRLAVQDDPVQTALAIALCADGVIVPLTVALETEWVLRSRYQMNRATISQTFETLILGANFHFENEIGVRWAVSRYSAGADFADMLHLVNALSATSFVTFDQALAANAGVETPLAVECLTQPI
jgi:predicted nucleic-acid-binding protein